MFAQLFAEGKRHVRTLNVADHAALLRTLREIGLSFSEATQSEPEDEQGTTRIEWRANLSDVVGRTVTKIALNYLALRCGAVTALRTEFGLARRYARYGEVPNPPIWGLDERTTLVNNPPGVGHALTLSFVPESQFVIAQIAFHNSRRYRVRLAEMGGAITQREDSGHFFDLTTRRIVQIGPRR